MSPSASPGAAAVRSLRLSLAAVLVLLLASCQTAEDSRKDRNRADLEAARVLVEKQALLEDFLRAQPPVLSARVFLAADSVIIDITPRDRAVIDPETQARINSYVTANTGIPREKIALVVPERAVPRAGEEGAQAGQGRH